MFIKRGTNEKILNVIDEDHLTEEQKEAVKKVAEQVKQEQASNKKTAS
jgi:hypothetical protein